MPKTVYLVRHGESESNAGPRSLGPEARLTSKGEQQAQYVAHRCLSMPIELIVTSGYPRADATAERIRAALGVPLVQSELFGERISPSATIGLMHTDGVLRQYLDEFWNRFTDPAWRFEDAENFDDLNDRAGKCLHFLLKQTESNICVVGHGIFSRVLAARAIFGEALTAHECLRVMNALFTENTGLSILRHYPDIPDRPWRIITWNDYAHLAD